MLKKLDGFMVKYMNIVMKNCLNQALCIKALHFHILTKQCLTV